MKKLLLLAMLNLLAMAGFASDYVSLSIAIGPPYDVADGGTVQTTVGKVSDGAIAVHGNKSDNTLVANLSRELYNLETSDHSILIVCDGNGNEDFDNGNFLKCLGAGEVTLTATLKEDNTVKGTMTYNVTTTSSETKEVSSIKLTVPALSKGGSVAATVEKFASDNTSLGTCTADEVTLSSSNAEVATVSGLTVTGVAAGSCVITATYGSLTATADVTVSNVTYDKLFLAIGSPFDRDNSTVKQGQYGAIVVRLWDGNGNYQEGNLDRSAYTVSSSDESVLIVGDINGNADFTNGTFVYAKGAGTATLTFKLATDESITNTMTYTVEASNKYKWESKDILPGLKSSVGTTINAYTSTTNYEGENLTVPNSVIGQEGEWLSMPYTESGDEGKYDAAPWWFIDLGTTYSVTSFGTLWASNAYPGTFTVYTASALTDESAAVSNDNITWNEAATVTVTDATDATDTEVSLTGVRFIKIQCTSAAAAAATYGVNFKRFYLVGTKEKSVMTVAYSDFTGADNSTYTGKKAVCTGDWVEDTFNAIDAYVIDLTAVTGVPSDISNTTKNPNAIVYATSASGKNVCTGKGASVSDLVLTDGKPFMPEQWFYITSASSFTVTLTAGQYSFVYLPCDFSEIPEGVKMYEISSVSNDGLTITEVTSISREKTYVIMSENGGECTLKGTKSDIADYACGTNNLNANYGGVAVTATLVESKAPQNSYMINRNNQIARVSAETGVTIQPFMAYITSDLSQYMSSSEAKLSIIVDGETTSISNAIVEENSNEQMYNLAGQAVSNSYRGLVIKNGKKFFNK